MAAPAKQATMYVVDLGSTMGECHNGRTESDLDYGMRYIWDKIAITMAANLKGGNLGVIGFRTDETNNPLDDDEDYQNISVRISLCLWASLSRINITPYPHSAVKQHM